ncbi:FHA domain-containing protein, partial [Acinetobacter baumannii]
IRIEQEKQLHDGDIVQFASFKFSVLAPAQKITDLPEVEAEPVQAAPTQDLSDQGMPSLAERAAEVEVRHDGMPQNISIPKPAP